jgi:C-terminal processing protease CtpA/Prc
MRSITLLLFCFLSIVAHAQLATVTPQQMKEDLDYLNKYLKKWHPTYYAYTKKEQMDAYYDRLKDSCTTTITASAFRATVRKAVNQVHCGHMGAFGFKGGAQAKLFDTLRIFPLKLWVLNNRLFIKTRPEKDSTLAIGDEILAINGKKTSDLITETAELAVTDALNTTHKMFTLEINFHVFHYFLYGQQDNYALTIKNKSGAISEVNIKGELEKEVFKDEKIKTDSANCVIKGNSVALYKTDFDSSTMIVDIDNFNGARQGKTFRQIFKYLRKNKTKNLIIDLRDNGGGNVFRGNKFLTYLLDQAILPMVISRKPNLTMFNPNFKARLMERTAPLFFMLNPLQYPNRNGWNHCFLFFKKYRDHFDGNVYVMTNAATFSMASYVATYLKYKKQAVVVGEETGGSEYASRAMATGRIKLPNSEVKVQLNVYQMKHLIGIEDKAHGLMPTHPIEYSVEDKMNQSDLEMEKIKTLIKSN